MPGPVPRAQHPQPPAKAEARGLRTLSSPLRLLHEERCPVPTGRLRSPKRTGTVEGLQEDRNHPLQQPNPPRGRLQKAHSPSQQPAPPPPLRHCGRHLLPCSRAKRPFPCQSCHQPRGHPGLPGDRTGPLSEPDTYCASTPTPTSLSAPNILLLSESKSNNKDAGNTVTKREWTRNGQLLSPRR